MGNESNSDGEDDKGADGDDIASDASSEFRLGGGKASKSSGSKAAKGASKPQPPANSGASVPEKRHRAKGPGAPAAVQSETPQINSKAVEKGKAALEQATKVLGTLAPLTPSGIWNNACKDADVTARLKKASTTASQLSQQATTLGGSPVQGELEGLANQLEKKVNAIGQFQEVLGRLKAAKQVYPILTDGDLVTKFSEVLPQVEPDTLSNLLMSVGQRLAEVWATKSHE